MVYLDSGEDDACIGVLELGYDALADVLALASVFRGISREDVQDCYSAPLRAFVKRDQEFVDDVGRNWELVSWDACGNGSCVDIGQSGYGVCHNLNQNDYSISNRYVPRSNHNQQVARLREGRLESSLRYMSGNEWRDRAPIVLYHRHNSLWLTEGRAKRTGYVSLCADVSAVKVVCTLLG